jgi:hypothetical protein
VRFTGNGSKPKSRNFSQKGELMSAEIEREKMCRRKTRLGRERERERTSKEEGIMKRKVRFFHMCFYSSYLIYMI